MSPKSGSLTKDPSEGIRQLLGKHTKILLRAPVRMEKHGDKTDSRIIVVTPHRLYIMTNKVPTKIDHQFHFLEIVGIESKKNLQLVFRVNEKSYSFRPGVDLNGSEQLDRIIVTVATAIRNIFPGVLLTHILPKIEVVPMKRIQGVLEMKPLEFKDMGPCGGFSAQYSAYCDLYGLPYREEVAWDVDTIYFSHDSHELALADFEHLDHKDLICIISALEYNTWFTKLSLSPNSSKMANDVLDRILSVVSKSISLQELFLSSSGLRADFFQRLASAMTSNQCCNLTTIDISLNFVEDKGMTQISTAISHFPRGLRHLNLSHCALSGKAVNPLCQALVTNKLSLNSLTYLNISGNSLREDIQHLTNFLAQPNVISILDLSSTEIPSELLFSALVRGCTAHLSHLNLSRNHFVAKKSKGDIPATFKQFFATSQCLKYLNLSHGKLPSDALKHLLLGLACNENIKDVELNISNNNLGSSGGASVMENALPGIKCVSRLDLSENNFDVDLASVINGVTRCRNLLSLNISKNLPKIKARDVIHVTDAMVQLIQEEDSSLQKLNLSDCRLKTDLNNVINALGSNQCIQILDISGNGMGDVGARLLAKALQINTRLKTIYLDRNNITLQGYQDITYALQSNFSMRHIPFPTYDLLTPMKASPDRVDVIIRRMQDCLQRNCNPRAYASRGKNFRLTQGFLLSSTQQVLDRWTAQVQDTLQTVKQESSDPNEEVCRAEGYVRDADQCRLLVSSLQDSVALRDKCPVQLKLDDMADQMQKFLQGHIDNVAASMLKVASEKCPTLCHSNTKTYQELKTIAASKSQLQPDFVKNLVLDTLGYEVRNKVNEMNLILANHISDKVIDDVIDSLVRVNKSLVGDMGSFKKKRSMTPDVLKSSSAAVRSESESVSLSGDTVSQHSTPSPIATPQVAKRKSLHDRKLRPKSVVDSNEEKPDLLTNTSEKSRSGTTPTNTESRDAFTELPEIPQLQHLGKNRPRKPKRHTSSSSTGKVLTTNEGPNNDDFKDGLDSFFNKANLSPKGGVTPVGSPYREENLSRHGSISSSSSFTKSKEDIRDVKHQLKSSSGKMSPLTVDGRISPAINEEKGEKLKSGLSCLLPSTKDEDTEPLAPAVKSPDKKSNMSPSGRSISDIFGKVAQDKLSKSKVGPEKQHSTITSSPFKTKKGTDEDMCASMISSTTSSKKSDQDSVSSRRKSFLPSPAGSNMEGGSVSLFSDERSGEDEVNDVLRHSGGARGQGQALGGHIIKEMKVRQEMKRASFVPKTEHSLDKEAKEEGKPFGNVFLRSTGLSSSTHSAQSNTSVSQLTNTTSKSTNPELYKSMVEEKTSDTETIKHSSSSIIGLRAAAFDKSKSEENDDNGPKPRPPPKPRPWSIVGVDRKSGEYTQVESTASVTSDNQQTRIKEESEKKIEPNTGGSACQQQSLLTSATNTRGSVRDMIAMMNKPDSPGASPGSTAAVSSVRDRIASMNKGTTADTNDPGKKKLSTRSSGDPLAKSPSTRPKNSPGNNRKKESTSDDPRILKLEDDFLYDDPVNV